MTREAEHVGEKKKTQTLERRGLIAAVWALVLGYVFKRTERPVHAAANLLYQNVANAGTQQNAALGPTAMYSFDTFQNTAPIFYTYTFGGTSRCGLAGMSSANVALPSMNCGVYGFHANRGEAAPFAGVLGVDIVTGGVGVLGRAGHEGTGNGVGVRGESGSGIGVSGTIPAASSSNAIAVYGLNYSSFAGPGPGAGGFAVYGLSARGHGLVGATAAAGAAAVVGATNGVAGAYAAAFYGPVLVGGDLTIYGAKSAAVPHPDGTRRLMYCTESPESWFEDFGKARLDCGRAEVTIDPDFAHVADVSDYHVFVTGYGRRHLAVTERTATGFRVEADVAGARHDGRTESDLDEEFSWRLVARRRDLDTARWKTVTMPPEPERPYLPDAMLEADPKGI